MDFVYFALTPPPPPGFRKSAHVMLLLEVKQEKRGGVLFQMGACCNLIGKAVPIAQVSVGPYRLSSIQTSLVSATLEIKSKSLLSPKVADVWHLEAVPVATVSTALDAANHPHVHDKLTKRTPDMRCLSGVDAGSSKLYLTS